MPPLEIEAIALAFSPFHTLRSAASILRPSSLASAWRAQKLRAAIARDVVRPAEALTEAGRFDEADVLLQDGLNRAPLDPDLLYAAAMNAQKARRISEAIDRWKAARDAAPTNLLCHLGLTTTLRVGGRVLEAQEAVREAETRFPGHLVFLIEAAKVAEARADFATAYTCWRQACDRPGAHLEWMRAYALVMVLLRRFDEAEAYLDRSLAPYQTEAEITRSRGLLAVRGLLASAREDWPAAAAFWTDFQARFPDDDQAWHALGRVRQNLAFAREEATDDLATGTTLVTPARIDVVPDEARKSLLMQFESLGDSCEFGLVQRRYGAEPLSLLRWNTVDLDALIGALRAGFEGLGEEANTELTTALNGEFLIRDRRWGFAMHTWLFVGQTQPDALFEKMCRRLVFLRTKLLAELESAEKIFVFLSKAIDPDSLASLHRSLRAFGPVTLLGIQPANGPSAFRGPSGGILKVAEDRYVGFIERLGQREDGSWAVAFNDWVSVCENARAAVAASHKSAVAATDLQIND